MRMMQAVEGERQAAAVGTACGCGCVSALQGVT